MPIGTKPPRFPVLSSSRTALADANASYSSSSEGFVLNNTTYWLCVERQSGTTAQGEWFHATASEAATNNNPLAKMSQTTFNVLHGGTYSTSNYTYSYSGKTYEILIEVD